MKVTKQHHCTMCGDKLTDDNTYQSLIKTNTHRCKVCQTIYMRPRMAEYNRNLKLEIIKAYGGKCRCCGEKTFEFLSIDHKHGGGHQHVRKLGGSPAGLYRYLRNNNFPRREFQLLCMNCNFAKGVYGRCPHKKGAK